jgi:uncharacterized protein
MQGLPLTITLIIGLFALILLGLSYIFFYMGFSNMKKTWIRRSKDIKTLDYSIFKSFEPWLFQQNPQDLWITSKDDLKLHAYYLPCEKTPKALVILHHGYTSQGKNMAIFAKLYRDHLDVDILVLDMRAHGQSEGRYLGFGYLEKEDTRQWIQTMKEISGQYYPVILHGISLGGSTVLSLAGHDCPEDVKIIISDSGFSDLNQQFKRQFKEIFHLPSFPLIPLGSFWCKINLGFSFKEASPIRNADHIKVPTLIIHGLKDMFVPYPMSNDLYSGLRCKKQLIQYENAAHALTYPLNKEDYETQVLRFIQENLYEKNPH